MKLKLNGLEYANKTHMNLSCIDRFLKLCSNSTLEVIMGRMHQVKTNEQHSVNKPFKNDFTSKVRLNLNDLLKRRKEEMKVDRRTNVTILSGAAAVAVVILVALSL